MFSDNQTLYLTTLALNPGSWMAHNNLGLAWSKMPGRLDDAVAQYREALRLKPDIAETHTNLGSALSTVPGKLDDAIAEFQEALRLDPRYPDAHFYLANALVQKGRIPEAIEHYEDALRADPGLAEASNNLGMILCRTGSERGWAWRASRPRSGSSRTTSRRISPGAPRCMQAGRRDDAAAEFERVLQLRPDFPPALRMLEMIRAPR
jgi:protein O-mannosyl-transferase